MRLSRVVIALTGLILGLLFYFLGRESVSTFIWAATLVLGGAPIVYHTLVGMFKGQFASDIIAMLAIIAALWMDQFFAGAVIVLMQSGGEALEEYGMNKAQGSLKALLERAPRFAFRKQGDSLEQIDVKNVQVGDQLLVRPGDLIPVDGTIVDGSAEIDESALTGEPLAKSKSLNDPVFSGTIDVNGAFVMRAEKLSQESQYQKIVDLVQKAQFEKAPIQRLADRYAIFFTPLTLAMCLLGWLLTKNPTTILSVLVVATPCPLILATPLAILCGINKSAKNGIIVKGGAAMEQVGQTKVAIFDKTGTITYGTPFVEEIIPLNHEPADDLLQKCGAIEQLSSHSIAKAVVEKAPKPLPLPTNFQEFPGQGVVGDLDGHHYTIGSYRFLSEKVGQTCFANCDEAINRFYNQQKLLIFIAKDQLCVGIFVISDQIRPNVKTLVQELHNLGVEEVMMVTGDSAKNAQVIANQAGIATVKAGLLPEEKVRIVNQYSSVTMIGDGINDAPALASATTGIAMGAFGSAISAEAADIVLLVDDISKVAIAISIGKETIHIAKESILIGIGLSFLLMCIAIFGFIEPFIGAMLQEIIDVAVILNALRVR